MSEDRDLLERASMKIAVPEDVMGGLRRRRDRKDRNRRVSAAVLVAVLAALSITGLVRAFGGSVRPAQPTPTPNAGIFSGLGGWIVYGSAYGDRYGDTKWIWAVDPERPGMMPRRISTDYGEPLAWSSDGSKVLVLRMPTYRHSVLYVLNADGSETQVVTGTCPNLWGASLSPDGSKVVYSCVTPNMTDYQYPIYVVDASGGTPRRIGPPGLKGYDPVFSPDGSKIAYLQAVGGFPNALSVMNADGSGSHVLLKASQMPGDTVGSLAWFPDGRRLLFGQKRGTCCSSLAILQVGGPNWIIYTVNVDGSGLTRVGHGANPTLSPDGSRIAYFGESGLVIANVDGTHPTRITNALWAGPWNPAPYEPRSGALSTSSSPGATRLDIITYSIVALIALGLAAFWLRRRRPAIA